MKFGLRTPSVKKSISARTTGRAKRSFKRLANPLYGKAGMGWLTNPSKAARGKAYRKSTVSFRGFSGFIAACIYYPLYWTFLLMFWMLKICFMAMIFLLVCGINLLIWIAELIYNAIADSIHAKRLQAESDPTE